VLLRDPEGQRALRELRRFVPIGSNPDALIFHSKRDGPLLETTILNQGLYPALEALGLKKAGLHALRRGCNRRWELAGTRRIRLKRESGKQSMKTIIPREDNTCTTG
jgi:integrase